ncbi:MAG TPA: FAD-binding domain-containing protein, partial [Flavisolibacter sp.]|nr:FAD-binding domain-containing protein [Flavisolibacter sp.]
MKAASGLALACVTELFPTAYDQIRARVEQVDPVMYDRTRNFTDGKISYLSPYISRGILSGKKVQDNVLSKGYWYGEIETFLKELAWREYFQRIQQVQNKLEADLRAPQSGVLHHLMVQALEQANTGIHALDTAINTLYTTGYLHNHLRMFLASLACNIARAHWRMPARWMYYHLLDGDIASNTCSWQWVAGSFSNKKYFCNQENINTYTRTSQHQTFLDRPYDELSEME